LLIDATMVCSFAVSLAMLSARWPTPTGAGM
jgi:hypothetical protein